MNSADDLAIKLKKDFNVTIKDTAITSNGSFEACLIFNEDHTNDIEYNLRRFTLYGVKVGAESFAKMNNYVLPYNSIEDVKVLYNSPYEIYINGVTPLIYFFVYKLLSK